MKREKGANFVRQSYAGVIRQRLAHIERKIAFGSKQDELRKELAKTGFEASPGTFRKSLWRARRWWRIQLHSNSKFPNAKHMDAIAQVSTATTPTPFKPQSVQNVDRSIPNKPTPVSSQRIKRDELDQFFHRKSVFTKT
jgi:hypothetical protein